MTDTELFQLALERFRQQSGDKRPYQLLPRPLQSKVLELAQKLKSEQAGSRKNKRRNALFSFHPGMLSGRQQRSRYGRVPFNRRVAAMVRKARKHRYDWIPEGGVGSGGKRPPKGVPAVVADVASALSNLGYRRDQAKQMARAAASSTSSRDFDSLLRTALKGKNPMAKKKHKEKATRRHKPVKARAKIRRVRNYRRRNARRAAGRKPLRQVTRRRNRTVQRRRNRSLTFPIPITEAQKPKLKRFLSSLTGRRIKM